MVAEASDALLHSQPGLPPGWWQKETAKYAALDLSLDQWAAAQKPVGASRVDWSSTIKK
jgi:hypothetical protein